MTTRKFALAISTLTILSATACADIDERGPETSPATEQEPEQDPETEMTQITVSLDGLQSLGADFVYEGWLIVDGTPVSTGRFEIAENAESGEERGFWVAAADADAAGAFVLTIEPAQDDDAGPSAVKVLGGDIADGEASLSVAHHAAIGTDFSEAAGSYILMTPTTHDIAEDYNQGVWFLDPNGGDHLPSLWLPELPEGWEYEGWVVGHDGPISTGRFLSADGEDSDGAGEGAGPDGYPPFPGQDFIDPAEVLIQDGYKVVLTVEPSPDNSPAPFSIKPLIDTVVEDVGPGVLQSMENLYADNPSGTVRTR